MVESSTPQVRDSAKDGDAAETLVDQVHQRILDMLCSRGRSGNENLNVGSLAETFRVSRTPVNMALVRLENQGLIQRNAGGGWTTVPLTLKDIEEIFDVKSVLEPLVARRAAERVSLSDAQELVRIMGNMEAASRTLDLDQWLAADRDYHRLIFRMADNARLCGFQDQLNNQLYRLWVGYAAMEGHMTQSCDEHRRVGEAIVARDPDAAAQQATNHIVSLRGSLIDVIRRVLIPFLGEDL